LSGFFDFFSLSFVYSRRYSFFLSTPLPQARTLCSCGRRPCTGFFLRQDSRDIFFLFFFLTGLFSLVLPSAPSFSFLYSPLFSTPYRAPTSLLLVPPSFDFISHAQPSGRSPTRLLAPFFTQPSPVSQVFVFGLRGPLLFFFFDFFTNIFFFV